MKKKQEFSLGMWWRHNACILFTGCFLYLRLLRQPSWGRASIELSSGIHQLYNPQTARGLPWLV